jgi:hypothetical protein
MGNSNKTCSVEGCSVLTKNKCSDCGVVMCSFHLEMDNFNTFRCTQCIKSREVRCEFKFCNIIIKHLISGRHTCDICYKPICTTHRNFVKKSVACNNINCLKSIKSLIN